MTILVPVLALVYGLCGDYSTKHLILFPHADRSVLTNRFSEGNSKILQISQQICDYDGTN